MNQRHRACDGALSVLFSHAGNLPPGCKCRIRFALQRPHAWRTNLLARLPSDNPKFYLSAQCGFSSLAARRHGRLCIGRRGMFRGARQDQLSSGNLAASPAPNLSAGVAAFDPLKRPPAFVGEHPWQGRDVVSASCRRSHPVRRWCPVRKQLSLDCVFEYNKMLCVDRAYLCVCSTLLGSGQFFFHDGKLRLGLPNPLLRNIGTAANLFEAIFQNAFRRIQGVNMGFRRP